MMRMRVQVTACYCNDPSTSADCSAKSLISNLAGILDSSSEDKGSDLKSGNNRDTQEREIKAQLKGYLKEKRASIDENPMECWKTKLKYDKLSDLARKYLSAPPASIPIEQLQSQPALNMRHSENASWAKRLLNCSLLNII